MLSYAASIHVSCCLKVGVCVASVPWCGGVEITPLVVLCCGEQKTLYSTMSFLPVFLGRSTVWMLGKTPPEAMVTPLSSLLSSSSFLTAS